MVLGGVPFLIRGERSHVLEMNGRHREVSILVERAGGLMVSDQRFMYSIGSPSKAWGRGPLPEAGPSMVDSVGS